MSKVIRFIWIIKDTYADCTLTTNCLISRVAGTVWKWLCLTNSEVKFGTLHRCTSNSELITRKTSAFSQHATELTWSYCCKTIINAIYYWYQYLWPSAHPLTRTGRCATLVMSAKWKISTSLVKWSVQSKSSILHLSHKNGSSKACNSSQTILCKMEFGLWAKLTFKLRFFHPNTHLSDQQ